MIPDIIINKTLNPNTSPEMIEALAACDDCAYRSTLTEKLDCPVTLLEKLVADEDRDLRNRLAQNPDCSEHIKNYFLKTYMDYIRTLTSS